MSPGPNFLGKPPPSSGPFSVVGHLYAKGEAEAQELRAILLTIQKNAISDAEPGCHEYKVTVADDDPTTFALYEEYASAAAFKLHMDTPGFQTLSQKIPEICKDVHLRYFKQITS